MHAAGDVTSRMHLRTFILLRTQNTCAWTTPICGWRFSGYKWLPKLVTLANSFFAYSFAVTYLRLV